MNVPLSYFHCPNISLLCLTSISERAERMDSCVSQCARLSECVRIRMCVFLCVSVNAEEIVSIHQSRQCFPR